MTEKCANEDFEGADGSRKEIDSKEDAEAPVRAKGNKRARDSGGGGESSRKHASLSIGTKAENERSIGSGSGAVGRGSTPRSGGSATPRSTGPRSPRKDCGAANSTPRQSSFPNGGSGGKGKGKGRGSEEKDKSKKDAMGGGKRGPPRRVMKNPDFLQEHREKYGDHQRELRGAKEDIGRRADKENRKKKFLHGNYDTYYSYRNPGAQDDPRIRVLSREWIEGKRVLDIGCNSGAITIELARSLNPRHIMGVDIDASLIQKARVNLRSLGLRLSEASTKEVEAADGSDGMDKVEGGGAAGNEGGGAAGNLPTPNLIPPLSAVSHKGVEIRKGRAIIPLSGYQGLHDPDVNPFVFPYNCSFRREDFVEDEVDVDCFYDTILCLSVSKWVHFNHGDTGVKRLFNKVFQSLAAGGQFILEFQEWSSYKKKKSLTETFKRNCSNIKLRPEMFQEYLIETVGFTSVKELHISQSDSCQSKGFMRPLLVFFK